MATGLNTPGQLMVSIRSSSPSQPGMREIRLLHQAGYLGLVAGTDPFAHPGQECHHHDLKELAYARRCPPAGAAHRARWTVHLPSGGHQVDDERAALAVLLEYLASAYEADALLEMRPGASRQLWPFAPPEEQTGNDAPLSEREQLVRVAAAWRWTLYDDPVSRWDGGALIALHDGLVLRLDFTPPGRLASVHLEGDQVYRGRNRFGFALAALRTYGS